MKPAVNYTILLAGGFLLSISACTYDKGDIPAPNPGNCDTSGINYDTTIKPIILTYCSYGSSCHISGGSGPGNFTEYSELKAKIDQGIFQERVFVKKDMPPSSSANGPLPACEMEKLKAWVAMGAPDN